MEEPSYIKFGIFLVFAIYYVIKFVSEKLAAKSPEEALEEIMAQKQEPAEKGVPSRTPVPRAVIVKGPAPEGRDFESDVFETPRGRNRDFEADFRQQTSRDLEADFHGKAGRAGDLEASFHQKPVVVKPRAEAPAPLVPSKSLLEHLVKNNSPARLAVILPAVMQRYDEQAGKEF